MNRFSGYQKRFRGYLVMNKQEVCHKQKGFRKEQTGSLPKTKTKRFRKD
jgi:hypothetical protein